MRVVIDMQGAQGTNKNRGIGRYTKSLVKTIASIFMSDNKHEIILVLNGLFQDEISLIKNELESIIPLSNIRIWYPSEGGVDFLNKSNQSFLRHSAEFTREAFIKSLSPDILLIISLFEGLDDNSITSINRISNNYQVGVILYDLIPLINKSIYLVDKNISDWYNEKLDYLQKADFLLSISESSRQEVIKYLKYPENKVFNISTSADDCFQKIASNEKEKSAIFEKYSIDKPFIMYTGGIDYRKNIEGLIQAYANLPENIRIKNQLAIVCSMSDKDKKNLLNEARKCNLSDNDLILTGYVPENDLIFLYNLCKLFVFPSWHEGFGLPALEAMSCGKAAIGSNVSSIPEVIEREDALFDPKNISSITKKMLDVLENDSFRKELEDHSLIQSNKFSWDKSAKTAIHSMESIFNETENINKSNKKIKLKLAYVSPLPPVKSGIADYSAELIPYLSKYYEIIIISNQEKISDEWINNNCKIENNEWFINNYSNIDRVIYQFGNSLFHSHMFDLFKNFPGTITLHDFFLSGAISYKELARIKPNYWINELYYSHGYPAVKSRIINENEALNKYPCNLSVLQNSLGVIVHSEYSKNLANSWYGKEISDNWYVVPLLRSSSSIKQYKTKYKKELNVKDKDFLVCSFGLMGATKLNHKLINAWIKSSLSKMDNCKLIFVGQEDEGFYGKEIATLIDSNIQKNRINITGWTDSETFKKYLSVADIAVQLRTNSRGETSAAILDCFNAELPTIVNANGAIKEAPKDAVIMLDDNFTEEELIDSLESLRNNSELRKKLSINAKKLIETHHIPEACAEQYYKAIESFYSAPSIAKHKLFFELGQVEYDNLNKKHLRSIANSINLTFPKTPNLKQLFVDVSELVIRDSKTGIQRVVRSILNELLINVPTGWRVEPVYANSTKGGYLYARNFTLKFIDSPNYRLLVDEPIDYRTGDIFLGLDLQANEIPNQNLFLQKIRNHGVLITFVVYDLLCVNMPEHFVEGAFDLFDNYFSNISLLSDRIICISKATADEYRIWLQNNTMYNSTNIDISWFHLGCDIKSSKPSKGLPENAFNILKNLENNISFIMVGTIEPRKGHYQVLEAFESLWDEGLDINLNIVGKKGWLVDDLIQKIKFHPEKGKKLFYIDNSSDEFLEKLYSASTCLIASSYGEGFGLPLIEAGRHKISIIARDIPVFREVAEDNAFYFKNTKSSKDLVTSIKEWIRLYKNNNHPTSDNIKCITWEESVKELLKKII